MCFGELLVDFSDFIIFFNHFLFIKKILLLKDGAGLLSLATLRWPGLTL